MGADFYSRIHSVRRTAVASVLMFALAGCKTEKAPDQPTILGVPPASAYLGVEYSYNFGAYGGEDILDYSLTNAPSWLALEDTSNKARQGIIMRGVPGLTGGSRGDSDLGKTRDINLVTTDGRMAGAQPFDIDVKYNLLSLDSEAFSEGKSPGSSQTTGSSVFSPILNRKVSTVSLLTFTMKMAPCLTLRSSRCQPAACSQR